MSKPLMCHVVAGYPDADTCLSLMKGMCDEGVAAIEVQVPFSDPIADGPTIMEANDVALEHGMTTAGSFDLLERARAEGVGCDIYIMSYTQKALHFGLEEFCRKAAACGARGLIIPDLPLESPEHAELAAFTRDRGLELVPVLSPGMPAARLDALLKDGPSAVYVTSRRGITGSGYSADEALKKFVGTIRRQSGATVMIGFGIASGQDVHDALKVGDVAVVGSALIKAFDAGGTRGALDLVGKLARESGDQP